MFVIGLTGGIGTGKSLVSSMLEGFGAAIINADLLGHEVYKPQTDGWRDVVDTFGEDVLGVNQEVDRRKLGAIVFSDPAALEKLNAITHPRIYKMAEARVEALKSGRKSVAVLEAALLIEAKWTPLVDEVWVTTSSEEQVVTRLQDRNDMTEEVARVRIRSQMPQSERVQYANAVIDNSSSLEELEQQVTQLWNSRVLAHKESRR